MKPFKKIIEKLMKGKEFVCENCGPRGTSPQLVPVGDSVEVPTDPHDRNRVRTDMMDMDFLNYITDQFKCEKCGGEVSIKDLNAHTQL